MAIIGEAGEGRAAVYDAIDSLIAGALEEAHGLLNTAEEHLGKAHQTLYTELIAKEAEGVAVPTSYLLIHAMDLVMVAGTERDLARRALAAAELRHPTSNEGS